MSLPLLFAALVAIVVDPKAALAMGRSLFCVLDDYHST